MLLPSPLNCRSNGGKISVVESSVLKPFQVTGGHSLGEARVHPLPSGNVRDTQPLTDAIEASGLNCSFVNSSWLLHRYL